MPTNQTNLDKFLWSLMNWTADHIDHWSPDEWTMVVGFVVMFGVCGWRLGRFSWPESPRTSEFIRHVATALLLWPSLAMALWIAFLWAAFFSLCYALGKAPESVLELTPFIVSMVWGIGSGLLTAGIAYYWLIPSLELPTVTLAAANAKLTRIGNYDPERYFRV